MTFCDAGRIEKYRRIANSELDSRLFKSASAQGRSLTGSLAGTSREHRIDFVRRHPEEAAGVMCALIPKTAGMVNAARRLRKKTSDYDRGGRFVDILLGGGCAKTATDGGGGNGGGEGGGGGEDGAAAAAAAADNFWEKLKGMVSSPEKMWEYAKKHPDQVAGIIGSMLGGIYGTATGDGVADRMSRAGLGAVGGGAVGYGAGLLGRQIAEWLNNSRKKDEKSDAAASDTPAATAETSGDGAN